MRLIFNNIYGITATFTISVLKDAFILFYLYRT